MARLLGATAMVVVVAEDETNPDLTAITYGRWRMHDLIRIRIN
jgi:hypothetical protein